MIAERAGSSGALQDEKRTRVPNRCRSASNTWRLSWACQCSVCG
ncbi:hypothetical protein ABNQ39_22465 [Azospirillum sp. A26]